MSGEFLKGQVKWFNDAKGFGFIEHTSGKDVFVHYSVIDDQGFKTLKDGEQVLYELHEGAKGMHATKVVRIMKPQTEAVPQTEDQIAAMQSAASSSGSGLQVEVLVEGANPSLEQPMYAIGADTIAALNSNSTKQ